MFRETFSVDRDTTYLGSTVKGMADSGSMPVVIIKDPKHRRQENGKAYRFGVCFDTSRHSQKTLRTVCSMMHDHDKLVTITVTDHDLDHSKVEKQIDEITAEFKIKAEHVLLDKGEAPNVYTRVSQYLNDESTEENYVDFVGIGNRGIHARPTDRATLGSMAENLVHDRRINVIFVPCE